MKWIYRAEKFTGSMEELAMYLRADEWRKQWDVVAVHSKPSVNVTVDPRLRHDILYRVTQHQDDEHDADEWNRTHGDF